MAEHISPRTLGWVAGTLLVLVVLQSILFVAYVNHSNQQISSQIRALEQSVSDDIGAVQTRMAEVDQQHTETERDILNLVAKVQAENADAVAAVQDRFERDLANIEVSGTGFSAVISDSIDSVVSVLTKNSQGSGVFITPTNIVTNYHVIQGSVSSIQVKTYDRGVYVVDVVGIDQDADIAVLHIRNNESFEHLQFADSDNVKIGESVIALGNPYGLDFSATQGIVSARRTGENGIEYLQIDVPINPGNSGGPIIDSAGKIVGIANFKFSGGESLGFALPSNTVEQSVEDILG